MTYRHKVSDLNLKMAPFVYVILHIIAYIKGQIHMKNIFHENSGLSHISTVPIAKIYELVFELFAQPILFTRFSSKRNFLFHNLKEESSYSIIM